MILVVQRCKSAEVLVSKKIISKIKRGLVLLLGIEKKDSLKRKKSIDFKINLINEALKCASFNSQQPVNQAVTVFEF